MQEGELRRAPDEKDRASPSVVRPPPEKRKKTIAKAIKAKTLAPESQSTSTASMSSQSTSSAQASDGDSSSLRLDPSDPGTHHSEPKLESITLIVINEPKEEEDIQKDLPGEGLGGAGERGSSNGSAQSNVMGPSSASTVEKETGKKEAGSAIERLLVDCTVSKTTEVVISSILPPFQIMHTSSIDGAETLKLVEGEKRAISVEADRLKEKEEAMEAKYKRAEQENSQLRREVEELRLDFVAQKKEMKKLQAGFVA
ncbi:hypothetical protein CK203_070071 [Vitis vinifera]|uniref:Uncharacterized protein n=1 Tax=Vitis vinifera TaxID=29760 RepID=A0A438EHR1_VITVI|nr:hypothetical protein CK203_070071 [Vitis vinifera]